MITPITKYRTEDGEVFPTREEAERHELTLDLATHLAAKFRLLFTPTDTPLDVAKEAVRWLQDKDFPSQ